MKGNHSGSLRLICVASPCAKSYNTCFKESRMSVKSHRLPAWMLHFILCSVLHGHIITVQPPEKRKTEMKQIVLKRFSSPQSQYEILFQIIQTPATLCKTSPITVAPIYTMWNLAYLTQVKYFVKHCHKSALTWFNWTILGL